MSRGQTIVELMHELWQMPEYQLYQDLRSLDISTHRFHRNYLTLDTFLTFLTSDERADFLFIVKNHDKLVEVGKEIVCALHNYVAAEYREKVMAFYQWVQVRQDEIHADEIKRFRAKEAELQLLKVVDRIDSCFAFETYRQRPKHEVFLGILPSEDVDQLERASLALHEQAQLAIRLLEQYFPLSNEIRTQIFRLYKEA
jgi:hypothetical protein